MERENKSMTIHFPDVSSYNANAHITPGTSVVMARATLSDTLSDSQFTRFRHEAAEMGAFFVAYHWLNRENAHSQAHWAKFNVGRTPLMVDAEDVAGNTGYAGTLRVSDILNFVSEYRALGGVCHLVYLPHWYWQTMGSPDLTPLADAGLHLVASEYRKYTDGGWPSAYGHMNPEEWQYTNAMPYGGGTVDFNAYKGTVQQFIQLATGGNMSTEGQILNADRWAYAVANLLPTVQIAWADNLNDLREVPVPFTQRFTALETAVKNISSSGLTDADRALIGALSDGVGALNNRLATP